MRSKLAIVGLTSAGLLMVCVSPVLAAGSHDGNWVIDFPAGPINGQSGQPSCVAVRLPIQISDNQISGSLARTGMGNGVTSGAGSSGQPVTGQVQPDGTLKMAWQNYSATGKLGDTQGSVTVARSQCGPREGTAVRVGQ
jgi:hypothetical protein